MRQKRCVVWWIGGEAEKKRCVVSRAKVSFLLGYGVREGVGRCVWGGGMEHVALGIESRVEE